MRNLLPVLALLLASTSSFARPNYPTAIPNGSELNCGVCHVSAAGGGARNVFGLDIEANMPFAGPNDDTWATVFCADSDGDGKTNGQEAGDPCGTWKAGDDNPEGDITNPSDEEATTADVGECDGAAPEACELEEASGGCPCSSGKSPDVALSSLALAMLVFLTSRKTRSTR